MQLFRGGQHVLHREKACQELAQSMARRAETFRNACARCGESYDYQRDDGRRLDQWATRFAGMKLPGDVRQHLITAMGAYLGELVVKHCHGHWRPDSGGFPGIELPDGSLTYPLTRAAQRVDTGDAHSLEQYLDACLAVPADHASGSPRH